MKPHYKRAHELYDTGITSANQISKIITEEFGNELDVSQDSLYRNIRIIIAKRKKKDAKDSEKFQVVTGKSTLRNADGDVLIEWTKTSLDKEQQAKAVQEAIEALKDTIIPAEPVRRKSTQLNGKLCNQYTLTDYHLGMMAWHEESGDDWDMKIAEEMLVSWFKEAISLSPNAETAIFAQIGDFLHWDGLDAVTPTSGHVLDADSRFTKLVRVAIRVIRQIVGMLLEKYKSVHLIMAEGNHDLASSVWLRELFNMYYESEPRVTIDTNPDPYYCFVWGDVCLFYHHSHKKNIKALDSVFVAKFKEQFGKSKRTYAHTGHLHHDKVIETNLMRLEQHQTLAGADAHASRGGWMSGRSAKVITYHENHGEVHRSTINPDMLS